METLRVIRALGYRIVAPPGGGGATPGDAKLSDAARLPLPGVIGLWQLMESEKVRGWVEDYRGLGGRALKLGEPLLAYDILRHGLRLWPDDVRLRQLQARALANSGAAEAALEVLQKLRHDKLLDPKERSHVETVGLLGRVYKDLWERCTEPKRKNDLLRLSAAVYETSYRMHREYWTGINAATLAACLGDEKCAAETAASVREQCLAIVEKSDAAGSADYWALATLGEAALVLGRRDEARDYYARAVPRGRSRAGRPELHPPQRPAAAPRRAGAAGKDPASADAELDELLPMPRVVVFSGHMTDRPSRPTPRFPAEAEGGVAAEIARQLEALNAGIGYASAACGSDILFLEAVRDRGGEVNIVLPYELDQFRHDSVNRDWAGDPAGPRWAERLEALLKAEGTRSRHRLDRPTQRRRTGARIRQPVHLRPGGDQGVATGGGTGPPGRVGRPVRRRPRRHRRRRRPLAHAAGAARRSSTRTRSARARGVNGPRRPRPLPSPPPPAHPRPPPHRPRRPAGP